MINYTPLIYTSIIDFSSFDYTSVIKKSIHSIYSTVSSAFRSVAKTFQRYWNLLKSYIQPKTPLPSQIPSQSSPLSHFTFDKPLPEFMQNSITGCLPTELVIEGILTHLDLKSVKHLVEVDKKDAELLKQPRFLSFLLERQNTNKNKLIQILHYYENSRDKIENLTISMLDLKYTSIQDAELSFIFSKCSHLTRIDLSYCKQISNQAIHCLTQHCQSLKDLNLAGSGCNLNDEGIMQLTSHSFVRLESLSLAHHKIQLTDQGIKSFKACFPNLTSLTLCHCQNISHHAFSSLFKSYPELVSINIGECEEVTDDVIANLAKHCLKIQQVILTACQNITDQSLQYLAEHSRELKSLTVISCRALTLPALSHLISQCAHLKSVHTLFGRRQLAPIKSQYPTIQFS